MDTARAEKLKINFDIDFPRMPCLCELVCIMTMPLDYYGCADLSIDAMDVSGEHHLDVLHSVYKIRLADDGSPIVEEAEQYELGASQEEEGGQEAGGEGGQEAGGEGGKVIKTQEVIGKKEDKCGR